MVLKHILENITYIDLKYIILNCYKNERYDMSLSLFTQFRSKTFEGIFTIPLKRNAKKKKKTLSFIQHSFWKIRRFRRFPFNVFKDLLILENGKYLVDLISIGRYICTIKQKLDAKNAKIRFFH